MSKSNKTTTKSKAAAKPAKPAATKPATSEKTKAPVAPKGKATLALAAPIATPAASPEAAPATSVAPASVEPATSQAKAAAKPTGKAKAKPDAKPKSLSCLDAAVVVLKASGQAMQCKAMVEAMSTKGLWSTTAPTPHATLYSAILREVTTKGDKSRFVKTERGHFELTSAGKEA